MILFGDLLLENSQLKILKLPLIVCIAPPYSAVFSCRADSVVVISFSLCIAPPFLAVLLFSADLVIVKLLPLYIAPPSSFAVC